MKKTLCILLCLPIMTLAQQTYVPDDNFEQALINLGYDNVLDDYILTANINTIQYLNVSGQFIADLTGIEDFVLLKSLDCDQNQITSLDVSNNIALEHLGCGCNCSSGNLLTSLDVSQNVNLTWLQCEENQLTNIDLSNNPLLTFLGLSANQLTTLDVSNNLFLEEVTCGWNPLVSLDFTNNLELKKLVISNPFHWDGALYLGSQATITSLDISLNSKLEWLNMSSNKISSAAIADKVNLIYLAVSDNLLSSLDVSNMINLEQLLCSDFDNVGQLTDLDVSNNPLLWRLHCEGNQLTTLDLSNNPLMNWLSCEKNNITSLDVSNLSALTMLTCNNNALTELNIANNNNNNFESQYPLDPSLVPALDARDNPALSCIEVDDATYSINNWTNVLGFYIDPQQYFNNNCGSTEVNEGKFYGRKKVIRITDLLGRETKRTNNQPLFYIFDDGTVEKRIVIE